MRVVAALGGNARPVRLLDLPLISELPAPAGPRDPLCATRRARCTGQGRSLVRASRGNGC